MTPGETGGVLGVLEIQSPEGGDTSQILYRPRNAPGQAHSGLS